MSAYQDDTESWNRIVEIIRENVRPTADGKEIDGSLRAAEQILASPVIARIRAEAWDEGRRGAIADHEPPLSGFAHRENPYRRASIHSVKEES